MTILSQIIEGLEMRKSINKLLDNCKQISNEIKRKVDSIVAYDKTDESADASRKSNFKLKPQPAVLNKIPLLKISIQKETCIFTFEKILKP